jgi:hypothetical protein
MSPGRLRKWPGLILFYRPSPFPVNHNLFTESIFSKFHPICEKKAERLECHSRDSAKFLRISWNGIWQMMRRATL